jgi:2-oxoglutarate ferredoxin oxidoreductase subunit alpha
MILSDGVIGQMMEPLDLNNTKRSTQTADRSWVLDGCAGRKPRLVRSLLMAEGALEQHNWDLKKKFDTIRQNEVRCDVQNIDDADIILVAFGISARVAKAAMQQARSQGIKAGFIRPITLWPFPEKIIAGAAKSGRKFLTVEMNLGQMVEDVRLAVNGKCPVEFLGRPGGGVVSQEEVLEKMRTL